jgi:hypothetical protein
MGRAQEGEQLLDERAAVRDWEQRVDALTLPGG